MKNNQKMTLNESTSSLDDCDTNHLSAVDTTTAVVSEDECLRIPKINRVRFDSDDEEETRGIFYWPYPTEREIQRGRNEFVIE
jgi:hypothetical protein